MPRQERMDELLLLNGKIRKRGSSPSVSSTSSSVFPNYRFKRAVLVGKRAGSSTPVPSWKLLAPSRPRTPSSSAAAAARRPSLDSPRSQCVSARKLAATLWEMNDVPSPSPSPSPARGSKEERRLRKAAAAGAARSARSGSLPPQLSDPSHSPVSDRMDRSGTGSRHHRASSIVSQRLRVADHGNRNAAFDCVSNASLMEIEPRSRAQTPSGSVAAGTKTRLKDVSNALTTSKELLKIINRVWGNEDKPSSSMSLISALHAELERARLQVNHLIQDQRSDQNEVNYLMKCFAEEKAAWKNKEQKIVEAAIASVAGELEVEKKLRKRLESLNKKLGKELADTKASLTHALKELENEKKVRVVMEQVCDELARDVHDDKVEAEAIKRESVKLCEEVKKEREIMQFADALREERVQMKLSDAKYQLEEKNAAVDKLRSQLEAFLGTKRTNGRGSGSFHRTNDTNIAAYLNTARFASHQNEENDGDDDGGEVEDGVEHEDSAESDLHSFELNMDNNNRSYKWIYPMGIPSDIRKVIEGEEIKARKSASASSKVPMGSPSLKRSISDGLEWVAQNDRLPSKEGLDWERYVELERQAQAKGSIDEILEHRQSMKGSREQLASGFRTDSPRAYASPTRESSQLQSSRYHSNGAQERPPTAPGNVSRSRLSGMRSESLNARKSKW